MMIHFFYILFLLNFAQSQDEFVVDLGSPLIADSLISHTNRGCYQDRFYINVYNSEQLSVLVDSYSGNLFVRRTDFSHTNYFFPFDFTFYYNSGSSSIASYGNRWHLKYHNRFATNNFNNKLIIISETDKSELFLKDSSGNYYSNHNFDSAYFYGNQLVLTKPFNSHYAFLPTEYFFDVEDNQIQKIIIAKRDTIKINFQNFLCNEISLLNNRYNLEYKENLLSELNFNGIEITNFDYDANNNLINVNKNYSDDFRFEYNECNLLSKIIFSNGRELNIVYNDSLQVSEIYYFNDLINKIEIQYFDDYTFFKDFYKGINKVYFDKSGRFVKLINPKNNEKNVNYLSSNNFQVSDYLKNYSDYNLSHNSYTITNPLQSEQLIKFGVNGVTSRNNYNNNSEFFDYNGGVLTVKSDYEGEKYYFQHNSDRNLIEIINTKDDTTNFDYDEYGNIKQLKINDLEPIYFEYDEIGNIAKILDNGKEFQFEYEFGLKNNIIIRDSSGIKKATTSNNERKTQIISLYDTLNFSYDQFGRLTNHKNYQIKFTDYSAEITDNYSTYKLKYDSLFKIISIIDNDYDIINKSYDANDNLIQVHKNSSIYQEFQYDRLNRMIFERDFDNNTYQYDYDNMLNIVQTVSNGSDKINYSYSKNGELENVKLNDIEIINAQYEKNKIIINSGKSIIYENNYDAFGRLINEKINQDTILTKDYHSYSLLPSLIDSSGIIKKFSYDSFGNLKLIVFNDSIYLNLVYNHKSQLTSFNFNNKIISEMKGTGNLYIISDNYSNSSVKYENGKISEFTNPESSFKLEYLPNKLINKIDFTNRIVRFRYDDFGFLSRAINNEGLELNIIRKEGKIAEINGPRNSKIQLDYYPNYALRAIIDTDNSRTTITRNNFSLPITILEPDNNTRAIAYSENFNIDLMNENGNVYNLEYNARNSITSIIDPEFNTEIIKYDQYARPIALNSAYTELDFTYDTFGFISTISNSDLSTEIYRDNLLRINQIRYEDDVISYFYTDNSISINLNDEKVAIFDSDIDSIYLLNTTFNIVNIGNIKSYNLGNKNYSLEFNPYHLFSNITKNNASSISIIYDELGRESLKLFSDDYFELSEYELSGKIKNLSTPFGKTGFNYNKNGLLSTVLLSGSDSIIYTYDNNKLISGINLPGNIKYSLNRQKNGNINYISGISPSEINFIFNGNAIKIMGENNIKEYYFDKSFRINSLDGIELHQSGFKLFSDIGNHPFSFNPNLTLKSYGNNEYIYSDNLIAALYEGDEITTITYKDNKINNLTQFNGASYHFEYLGDEIQKISLNNTKIFEKIKNDNFGLIYYLQPYNFEVVMKNSRIDSILFDDIFAKFNYDIYGNINEIISNLSSGESYFYDANGNMVYLIRDNMPHTIKYTDYFQIKSINHNDSFERFFNYNSEGYLKETVLKNTTQNFSNIDYNEKNDIERISSQLDDRFFFSEFEYDSTSKIATKSNSYGFVINYENSGEQIIFSGDTVNVYKSGDTLIKYLPNSIIERNIIRKDNSLARLTLIRSDSVIFDEIYEYNQSNKLARIINKSDVYEFKYNYAGLLFSISKNSEDFIAFERNNFTQISKKIIENDTINYYYNNKLQLIAIDSIIYQYNDLNQLEYKKSDTNHFVYKYDDAGKLVEIIKNNSDTLTFIYNGANQLIAFSDTTMKYITFDNNSGFPLSINGDNKHCNFVRFGNNNYSPDCIMMNDSAIFFHRSQAGYTTIQSDNFGNITDDFFSLELNLNYNNANIALLDSAILFHQFQVYYKNDIFWDINSHLPIQPDKEAILLLTKKSEKTKNLNIKIKLEDIINIEPNYFKFNGLTPQKIEKDIYDNYFNLQFNEFATYDLLIDFIPKFIFNMPQYLRLKAHDNLKKLEPKASIKLPDELNNPHIRSLVMNSDTLQIPKMKFPHDPLEKVIMSLQELGIEYQALVDYLSELREVYNSQLFTDHPKFISSPLYFEVNQNEINEIISKNPLNEQYVHNFGNDFDWLEFLFKISNKQINQAFAEIEEYNSLDRYFDKREYAVNLNYFDEAAFMPEMPVVFDDINKVNQENYMRVFNITDVRLFNQNKLFIPGRATYSSPELKLPFLLHSPNNYINTPLNQKNFDILHFEIE